MPDALGIVLSGMFALWLLFFMVRWFGLWVMETWVS